MIPTLSLFRVVSLSTLLVLVSLTAVQAAEPPEAFIKEVINDCEELFDPIPVNNATGTHEIHAVDGEGYKGSKGLHVIFHEASHSSPQSKLLFNAPNLELGTADGLMFWVKAPDKIGINVSAGPSYSGEDRLGVADGVLVMDKEGNLLDASGYLIKHQNGQRTIALEPGFEGWIIIPNTVSEDGVNTGWIHPSGQPSDHITDIALWCGKPGEIYFDHLSLYQRKPDSTGPPTVPARPAKK